MGLAVFSDNLLDGPTLQLYHRARADSGWLPKTVVDWTKGTSLPEAQQEYAWHQASRHVYAEQTGLAIAAKLLEETEDVAIRLSLATAVSDEAKHSEVFARYAIMVGGSVDPPTDAADSFYDGMHQLPSPEARFIVHTALEGLALDEFALLAAMFKADPLGQIYQSVRKDEARHVAIGLQYISGKLQTAPAWREILPQFAEKACELGGIYDGRLDHLDEALKWPRTTAAKWMGSRHKARIRRLAFVGKTEIGGE